MPKTYAAKRLLEHGSLTTSEFFEITGWDRNVAWNVLRALVRSGVAIKYSELGTRQYIWRLA